MSQQITRRRFVQSTGALGAGLALSFQQAAAQDDPAKVEAGETFTIQMKQAGESKRTAVVSGNPLEDSQWQLAVQHTSGSIDAFIRNERNRNLAIGFGIYLLLLGSIIAIVYSSLRAKAFAQRQIDFVSSVSHEFRTPLAVIYSAGENLADGVARDGEQVSRYGDLIKGEGKKLSAMVEQILEFAVTPRKVYYRLHGIGGWRYEYEEGELEELASMLPEDETSYVFFNNRVMFDDAKRFVKILSTA